MSACRHVRVVTPPAAYPATLAEMRSWCRIDSDDTSEDNNLTLIIAALTEYAEKTLTGRAFVERVLEASYEYFPSVAELPYPPLLGIESITYLDSDGNSQPVSSVNFEVNTVSIPGQVRAIQAYSWPGVGRFFNPVKYQYRAGYRPTASPTNLTDNSYLPPSFRLWLAKRVNTIFDNREDIIVGASIAEVPRSESDALLDNLVLAERLF